MAAAQPGTCHTKGLIHSAGQDQVAVLGLGYVGSVTAAGLAHLGHRVVGVDRDRYKVDSIEAGRAPFYEPGLEELICSGRASGRLSATDAIEAALADSDIALICVGTPSEPNGNLGLEQLRRVSREIGQCLPGRSRPLIVAVRSTVFPGTCEEIAAEYLGDLRFVAANPEFMREGNAVRDFLEPSLLVVGGEDRTVVERVAALYRPLTVAACLVSLRAAEMIKYTCNTFHALKVAFANEVGTLAAALEVPAGEMLETLCRDRKLNISPAYLKPGFAFGGACLPKDLRALVYRAGRLDLKLPLLETVLPSNAQHLSRAVQKVLDLPVERIGVYGLAFKENTDDLRESPVVGLLEQLIGKGRNVRVFDPHIRLDGIYGSNQRFLLAAIPHVGNLLDSDLGTTLAWAQHVVLTQAPPPDHAEAIRRSGLAVLNLAGANW